MSILSTVQYNHPNEKLFFQRDPVEDLADFCLTPYRWIAYHICNKESKFEIDESFEIRTISYKNPKHAKFQQTVLKVARIFFGFLFLIPGLLIGVPLKLLAMQIDSITDKYTILKEGLRPATIGSKSLDLILKIQQFLQSELENISDAKNLFYDNIILCVANDNGKAWQKITIRRIEEIKKTVNGLKKTYGKDVERPFHKSSGEIYNDDPKWLISVKGFVLATILTPIMTAIRILANAIMAVLHLVLIQPCQILDDRVTLKVAGKKIFNSFVDIFRSAIYGTLMSLSALFALVHPYAGRRFYGKFERMLHREEAFGPTRNNFYMAPCFQRLAKYGTDVKAEQEAKKAEETIDVKVKQKHQALAFLYRQYADKGRRMLHKHLS